MKNQVISEREYFQKVVRFPIIEINNMMEKFFNFYSLNSDCCSQLERKIINNFYTHMLLRIACSCLFHSSKKNKVLYFCEKGKETNFYGYVALESSKDQIAPVKDQKVATIRKLKFFSKLGKMQEHKDREDFSEVIQLGRVLLHGT